MQIKSFFASNVYGYLNFDIKFNPDLSFIIGSNGSGKTTALKLINALLSPNFGELAFTPFEKLTLKIKQDNKDIRISAEYLKETIFLSTSENEEPLVIDIPNIPDSDYINSKTRAKDEITEIFTRKNSEHPVIKTIASIASPIFLGLERKREDIPAETESYYYERNRVAHLHSARSIRSRRLIKGSLGVSLMETELAVQDAYRRMKRIEETYSTKLRDSILISAFEYTDFDFEDTEQESNWHERARILKRKSEIKEALSKIGINDSRLSRQVDTFFDRLSALFESVQASNDGFNIELLTNKAQIERIAKVVDIIDEHKSKIDKVFRPINMFLETINKFYIDSQKKLAIDTVGQLVVERPNGTTSTIEGLSSGERQLLVIFAHAFFNKNNDTSAVFIIDEPEISLHLRWQEMFAEKISKVSPNSQFIMATHSPEILGQNKYKAISCR